MGARIENHGYRKVAVKSPGRIDTIAPGKSLDLDRDLTERETAALLLAGATVKGGSDSKADARAARYAAIVAGLTADDMTQAGKPDVDKLNALLDDGEAKFDAKERDALYEASK